jgi:hypothetical protein
MNEKLASWFEKLKDSHFPPESSTENNPSLGPGPCDEDGSMADDFGVDDDVESGDRGQRYGHGRILGSRGDCWENTARVNSVFEAAGNPRYLDVKLKTVRVLRSSDPTHREIALKQAKRIATVDWG